MKWDAAPTLWSIAGRGSMVVITAEEAFLAFPPQQLNQELAMKEALIAAVIIISVGIPGADAAGDIAAGKAKAAACAGCHGPNGEGVGPNPALAGMSETQFIQAMDDYKSGKRANPVMKTFATPLSAQDNANLAAYYASLPKK